MRTHYDTTQPRISIVRPFEEDPADLYHAEREIGQTEAMGEAMFFLGLGYTVRIAEWDGFKFVNRCQYFPGDM